MEINDDFIKGMKQEESLKLSKMSKGYNWEIKLVGEINAEKLIRLEQINQKLAETYSNENGVGDKLK